MYTVKDISKMTGKCEETVRRWIRNGWLKPLERFHAHGRGSTVHVSLEDLVKFSKDHGVLLDLDRDENLILRKTVMSISDGIDLQTRLEHLDSLIGSLKMERKVILTKIKELRSS